MSFHHIHFRAIAHATESEENVAAAMRFILGDVGGGSGDAEIVASDTQITAGRTKGHFGNPIIIMEARLTRNRDMKALISRLHDNGILNSILDTLEDRLDDECNIHFRLDKQKAFGEVLALAENEDVIACSLKVAAYPANREKALETAIEYFDNLNH